MVWFNTMKFWMKFGINSWCDGMNSYYEIYALNSHMKYMYELIILNWVNEGQRKRTGSLSLQVKSGASTVRAASSRTSSRHIYISYIEFIVLIHLFNSYTKFIVLIHIINLQFFWWNLNPQAGLSKSLVVSMLIHCMNSYHEICTWINYMVK